MEFDQLCDLPLPFGICKLQTLGFWVLESVVKWHNILCGYFCFIPLIQRTKSSSASFFWLAHCSIQIILSEILKQVWDLADQDNDSMLSLREFCVALYLMERYREGRSLPASLPNSIMFDETLMRMTGLPHSSNNSAGWGATSGMGLLHILII